MEPLTDEHLDWCDAVMLTGMIVQRPSLHDVLQRCRRMGVRTIVGGPYATALPEDFSAADVVVVGEGEQIVPQMAADLDAGNLRAEYRETEKPDMASSPLPRYELLRSGAYHHMSLQYSRGLPVLLRVLRHHRHVRPQAAHQDV